MNNFEKSKVNYGLEDNDNQETKKSIEAVQGFITDRNSFYALLTAKNKGLITIEKANDFLLEKEELERNMLLGKILIEEYELKENRFYKDLFESLGAVEEKIETKLTVSEDQIFVKKDNFTMKFSQAVKDQIQSILFKEDNKVTNHIYILEVIKILSKITNDLKDNEMKNSLIMYSAEYHQAKGNLLGSREESENAKRNFARLRFSLLKYLDKDIFQL